MYYFLVYVVIMRKVTFFDFIPAVCTLRQYNILYHIPQILSEIRK